MPNQPPSLTPQNPESFPARTPVTDGRTRCANMPADMPADMPANALVKPLSSEAVSGEFRIL
ncbi:hypothetical protein E4U17_006897 [Claviceps sp. LM77 group G4]|nr:hypothetical protein E4U17_006897 [Claviceps sp. LM77 group G4]KAG6060939.1 hypothetical protein E4U33_006835 [Claviceps sp. LM78 group G4]KAG6074165.1 hypothetical protein E4U16_004180 [Claviceps sp. LM84 group G4]